MKQSRRTITQIGNNNSGANYVSRVSIHGTIKILFRASAVRNIEIWRSVDAHNRPAASKSI